MDNGKTYLRNIIRQRKRQFNNGKLQELSLAITDKLLKHSKVENAKVVMAYCSLPDEVSTNILIDKLAQMGKTIVLPKVVDNEKMEARVYEGGKDLCVGSYGISEPTGKRFDHIGSIDVVIVPGMAFDQHCHRLGRGKGYYDRFLAHATNAYKIGICFGFQMLEDIPTSPTDIDVDEVITDK